MNEPSRRWERAVVDRIRVGDESALALVYDQYAPLVHGIANRLVGSAEARDLCQEVFLSFWEHPDRFDSERGTLRTFFAVVTRGRCIDQLRRTGRRQAREKRTVYENPSASPNVEESAVAMIAAERVRDALQLLPVDQRRAIQLAYLDGLTFQGVATALGIPEGTAKSRLRLGLIRLSRELAGWNHGVGEREWA